MAAVKTTGLVCDPCSFPWFHHVLKCLSLESMACHTFGFVYSCLTVYKSLHGCMLWHCCSFSFLVHCTVLCLQWEHHNETTLPLVSVNGFLLFFVVCAAAACVRCTQSHTRTSRIPHNSVYTEQARRSKSGSLVTMTIQKSCDVTKLYFFSDYTEHLSHSYELPSKASEGKQILSNHLLLDAHNLGYIQLNCDYYYTPHFISTAEDSASPNLTIKDMNSISIWIQHMCSQSTILRVQFIFPLTFKQGGTWWRSWLRHCVTSQMVADSISDGVNGIFHWHNPSGPTMALGLTQPLAEMSTRNISWRVKAAGVYGWQLYHLHVPTVLKSRSLNLLEPSGPVQACHGIDAHHATVKPIQ